MALRDRSFSEHEQTQYIAGPSAQRVLSKPDSELRVHVHGEDHRMATNSAERPITKVGHTEEKRLRLKVDLHIIPPIAILYLFSCISRANIGNAKIAGLEEDLHLTGTDYNIVLTAFYTSYIIFRIPSTLLCKRLVIALGCGLLTLCTAVCNNIHTLCVVRFFFGLFDAGMLPGIAYYLARWYPRKEFGSRLSLYIVMAPLAGAFGGLLASGVLSLDHFGRFHRWRMLFMVDGIIFCGLSVVGFFTIFDSPLSARWLSKEEKDFVIGRVQSERPVSTEFLDDISFARSRRGIFNPVTITTGLIFLLINVTAGGLQFFAPTIVRTIYPDSSTVSQQLRPVPPYAVGAFFTILYPFLGWRLDRSNIFIILAALPIIVGYIMLLATQTPQIRWAALFFVASGVYPYGALCDAQISANVISDTARSAAIGTNIMLGTCGGLISIWMWLPRDSPKYRIGNGTNLATSSVALIVAVLLHLWVRFDNGRRNTREMSTAELAGLDQDQAQDQAQDLEWRHPAFRWKL
ncbi:retrograde regulation protein 2 [Exophiala viscosa]|uniref:Retrograde regulation protein 2 n=1 Tax=Exophiala viscosa TaxID=2486360 RepID=A0AAN6E7N0_9EURO|nr:retrograde regulation protein 2 [Exophiala viscosa]